MTLSAKYGDTAVTSGCSAPTTTTTTTTSTTTTPPPVISNESVTNITSNSVTIGWTTDRPATSKIEYWVGTVSGTYKEDLSYVTYHSITLAGLVSGATYTYNIVSRDANYYTGYIYNRTFTTIAPPQITTTTTTTTSTCSTGYHSMAPDASSSTVYCMSDTNATICQSLSDGKTYTCPTVSTTSSTTTTTQTTSTTSCPSNYHYMYPYSSGSVGYCMSDTNSPVCQPLGGGSTYTCPGYSSATTTITTTTTASTCDSSLITLLGDGCHYMYNDSLGNSIYCNSAMTQSAKKGATAVTQGCSSSGGGVPVTSTTCESALVALLGEGCHFMYNDSFSNSVYCNSAMTLSAKKGDTTVTQGCSSVTDSSIFGVTSANVVIDFDGKVRVTVLFSRTVDQTTLTESNIGIFRVADGLRVAGKIWAYASGFEYLTFDAPIGGATYELRVKKNVRNTLGNEMRADYISSPVAVSGLAVKTFSVDPSRTFPVQNASGVDAASRVRVGFTNAIDPDSLKTQFFSFVNMANSSSLLSGTFSIFSDAFEFVPSAALEPNAKYLYTVFATIKDITGVVLATPFSASFSTAGDNTLQGGEVLGKVTDSAGNPMGRAFVYFSRSDFSFSRNIETDASGGFSAVLPEGTYRVEVFPPFGGGNLIKPDVVTVTVRAGASQTLNFRFGSAIKTITGLVLFSSGNPVPDAEVGAYSSESGQQTRGVVDSKGRYTLKVDNGVWQVGIRPKDAAIASWSYTGPSPKVSFSKDVIAETQVADFTVPIADGKLIVKTVDQNGAVIVNAGVIVDTVSSAQAPTEVHTPSQFKSSDVSGSVIFFVRGGTYYVRGSLPPESGFLNSEEQSLPVYSGETRTLTLVFRKRDTVATVFLSGSTKFADGTPTDAFVWAWSEKGGSANTRSDKSGIFRMQVGLSERWHIGAGKEISEIPYKAPEVTVEAGTSGAVVELFLTKFSEALLSPSVSVSQSAAEHVVVQAQDGAKISVPPAAAGGSGTVQVEVRSTVEAPSQAGAQVVGTVYEITIRDAAGAQVTQLKENAEIVLPYSDDELKKQGVNENTIMPSFFDEETGSWVNIENYTVDKDKNIIIARVTHLTRFAIVAAADVTPPASPANVSGSALGNGKIKIVWTNPARDFNHAKVYKAERTGSLGEILSAEIKGVEVTDMAVRNGITYYYTVRAVDPAGNESGNTNQIVVRAIGTSATLAQATSAALPAGQAVKGELLRNLRQGNSGDDIKTLQSLLLKEGVYPQGLITGYFGALTKQAVVRFQEKYVSQILAPVGLTKGSGFVGPATRKKANELLK